MQISVKYSSMGNNLCVGLFCTKEKIRKEDLLCKKREQPPMKLVKTWNTSI